MIDKNIKGDEYKINDLNLASFLIASAKCQLIRVEKSDSNTWQKIFVLHPVPPDKIIEEYYMGNATVSALKILTEFRNLKSICITQRG